MQGRRELGLDLGAGVAHQNLLALQQQHLVSGTICLEPSNERGHAHAVLTQTLIVKLHQRLFFDKQIAATGP